MNPIAAPFSGFQFINSFFFSRKENEFFLLFSLSGRILYPLFNRWISDFRSTFSSKISARISAKLHLCSLAPSMARKKGDKMLNFILISRLWNSRCSELLNLDGYRDGRIARGLANSAILNEIVNALSAMQENIHRLLLREFLFQTENSLRSFLLYSIWRFFRYFITSLLTCFFIWAFFLALEFLLSTVISGYGRAWICWKSVILSSENDEIYNSITNICSVNLTKKILKSASEMIYTARIIREHNHVGDSSALRFEIGTNWLEYSTATRALCDLSYHVHSKIVNDLRSLYLHNLWFAVFNNENK